MTLVYVPPGNDAVEYQVAHVLGTDAVTNDPQNAAYGVLPGVAGMWHPCSFVDDLGGVGEAMASLDAVYAVLERLEKA